jgi:hypothetical protein
VDAVDAVDAADAAAARGPGGADDAAAAVSVLAKGAADEDATDGPREEPLASGEEPGMLAIPKKMVAARLIIDTAVGSAVDTSSFIFLITRAETTEMTKTPPQTAASRTVTVSSLMRTPAFIRVRALGFAYVPPAAEIPASPPHPR